jgi:hypothetical protein
VKTCSKCRENKALDYFGKLRKAKDGLYPRCKGCVKNETSTDKEYRREYNKQYKEKNTEKIKEEKRKWIQLDRARYPEKYREQQKEWRKNNPEKALKRDVYLRSRKTKAMPNWLSEQDKFEIEMYYRLARSRSMFERQEFHVDHVLPLKGKTLSGLHVPWNLRVIPGEDNRRKSNKVGN